jgi:hypothetical protein
MSEKTYWTRQKLFSTIDTKSGVILSVFSDNGTTVNDSWINYASVRVIFEMMDSRVNKGDKIKFELDYVDLNRLLNQFQNIFGIGPEKVFSGTNTSINKYTKGKKELLFSFHNDDSTKKVTVHINDTASVIPKSSVTIDSFSFKSLWDLLKDVKTSYPILSILSTLNLNQQISMGVIKDQFSDLGNELKSLIKTLKILANKSEITVSEKETTEWFDDDGSPKEVVTETFDVQKEFNDITEKTDFFDNIEIKEVPDFKQNPVIEKSPQPFLENILNWDLDRVKEWTTSFVCAGKNTKSSLFTPFDMIFELGLIPENEKSLFSKEEGYLYAQYIIMYLVKKYTRDKLDNIKASPIPVIKFQNKIIRGTTLFELSKGIITLLVLYTILNGRLSQVDTDRETGVKINDYSMTYMLLQILLGTFVFSIEKDNIDFETELIEVYKLCAAAGFIDKLETSYSEITGGKLNLNVETFSSKVKAFVGLIESTKKFYSVGSFGSLNKLVSEYKIPIPYTMPSNSDEIRDFLFSNLNGNSNKEDKPESSNTPTDKKPKLDKLGLFLESIKDVCDPDLYSEFKSVSNYDSLSDIFKNKNISTEILKIKRIMDIDDTLKTRTDVLKMVKMLKEDITVTESRVIQEDETPKNEVNLDYSLIDIISKIEN